MSDFFMVFPAVERVVSANREAGRHAKLAHLFPSRAREGEWIVINLVESTNTLKPHVSFSQRWAWGRLSRLSRLRLARPDEG
jgi:hypothetical protein